MINNGYSDSGQVRDNVGSVMNTVHVPYACYYKINRL